MSKVRLNNQRKIYETLLRERGSVRALDVGCGSKKFQHAIGLDIYPQKGVDVIADLEQTGMPFKDDSFDMVVTNHFIEHVKDIRAFMIEIHRILVPGGFSVIRTPYFSHEGSFRDPSHRQHLTLRSMDYFVADSPLKWAGLPGYFEKICVRLEFGKGMWSGLGAMLSGASHELYENNFAHMFPARVVFFALRVIK